MTKEEAERSPYRNVILQAVGQKKKLEVRWTRSTRAGLTRCCSVPTGSPRGSARRDGACRAIGGSQEAAETLVKLANERGGRTTSPC